MAISYESEVFSQNSIYDKSADVSRNRKLKIYFSVPEEGVNGDTGILLLIAGFGGNASSNVYKKMRERFSDEHNLVTVQCDYFGYEFMQLAESININKDSLGEIFTQEDMEKVYTNGQLDINMFLNLAKYYEENLVVGADLSKENVDNFNDMGIMQAIDNITAVINVLNILYDNNFTFNSKKIIIYGHSHGAYLSYLCNAFAPTLFSLIIDNSAWIYPVYLSNVNRSTTKKIGELNLIIIYDYLAKKIIEDTELLYLPFLYASFKNNCSIISYHGTNDDLISSRNKKDFCSRIDKAKYFEISEDKVDNNIFKSTSHGLDADFIRLFDYTMDKLSSAFDRGCDFYLKDEVKFETSKKSYTINYEDIIPKIYVK